MVGRLIPDLLSVNRMLTPKQEKQQKLVAKTEPEIDLQRLDVIRFLVREGFEFDSSSGAYFQGGKLVTPSVLYGVLRAGGFNG